MALRFDSKFSVILTVQRFVGIRGCSASRGAFRFQFSQNLPRVERTSRGDIRQTFFGLNLFDARRALDYLETRPEVQKNALGCAGYLRCFVCEPGRSGAE